MEFSSLRLHLDRNTKLDSRMSIASGRVSSREDRQNIDNIYVLPKITAVAFTAVLENAIDSLIVMGNMMNLPKVNADIEYKSISNKYSEPYRIQIYDHGTLQTCEVALEQERTLKFHKDRTFLEKILREVALELTTDKSFDKLKRRIVDHEKTITEENLFLNRLDEIEGNLGKFQKTIEEDKFTLMRKIQVASENVGTLKDEYQKMAFENEVKFNYIQKWQLSRYECNNSYLDVKEDDYFEVIREKNNAIDREARIHAEIETFLTEVTKEYEESTLHWIDRYEKEMEQLEMDVQILKEKRDDQMEKMELLSQEYNRRTTAISDYLALREVRRLEQQELDRKKQAATKIQAWWRGVMVRKCLGPYRKKKGKKGKGNKGKGDKKGKQK